LVLQIPLLHLLKRPQSCTPRPLIRSMPLQSLRRASYDASYRLYTAASFWYR
jgi:hypothetical protein